MVPCLLQKSMLGANPNQNILYARTRCMSQFSHHNAGSIPAQLAEAWKDGRMVQLHLHVSSVIALV